MIKCMIFAPAIVSSDKNGCLRLQLQNTRTEQRATIHGNGMYILANKRFHASNHRSAKTASAGGGAGGGERVWIIPKWWRSRAGEIPTKSAKWRLCSSNSIPGFLDNSVGFSWCSSSESFDGIDRELVRCTWAVTLRTVVFFSPTLQFLVVETRRMGKKLFWLKMPRITRMRHAERISHATVNPFEKKNTPSWEIGSHDKASFPSWLLASFQAAFSAYAFARQIKKMRTLCKSLGIRPYERWFRDVCYPRFEFKLGIWL